MATIKTKNHEFQLVMDLPTLIRIKKELQIDLVTRQGIEQVCSSFLELAPVIYQAVRDHAKKLDLSEEQLLEELITVRADVIEAWVVAMRDFFQRAGYAALARVATAMVEIGRREEQIADQLLDDETAKKLVDRSLSQEANSRRKQLDRLLADLDASESDASTPGKPSPSSPRSPGSIPSPNL